MLQWYYSREGYKYGPVSRETLRRLAGRGTLGPDDLVWSKGLPDWRPARAIPGLFTTNTNGLTDIIPDELSTKQTESPTLSDDIVQSQSVRNHDSVFANFLSWLYQGASKFGKTISWLFETMYDQAKMLKDQNVISELKSICASLWSTSLNFWIRFSAWFLTVAVSNDRDSEKSSTTIRLSLRDIANKHETERAALVPNATLLGNVLHATAIVASIAIIGLILHTDPEQNVAGKSVVIIRDVRPDPLTPVLRAKKELFDISRKVGGEDQLFYIKGFVDDIDAGSMSISMMDQVMAEQSSPDIIAAYWKWRKAKLDSMD